MSLLSPILNTLLLVLWRAVAWLIAGLIMAIIEPGLAHAAVRVFRHLSSELDTPQTPGMSRAAPLPEWA